MTYRTTFAAMFIAAIAASAPEMAWDVGFSPTCQAYNSPMVSWFFCWGTSSDTPKRTDDRTNAGSQG